MTGWRLRDGTEMKLRRSEAQQTTTAVFPHASFSRELPELADTWDDAGMAGQRMAEGNEPAICKHSWTLGGAVLC